MRRFPVTESRVSDDPADLFISYANNVLSCFDNVWTCR